MANVGITFDFAAESAKLRSEIDKVRKELGTLNDRANRVGDGFKTLGTAMLGAFSAGAIVSQMTQAAKAAIQFGDEMQKAAARTGIAAGQFALLADAAKLADIDTTSLSKSLQKMQVAISEAGSGSKSQLEAFRALGIEFEQLQRLAPEDQFLRIAEQISKVESPADRVRAAVELFGKAGAELLPFFEQGAGGIRKATDEIVRMGGALTDSQISNLADADTAIKRLSQSWTNFAREMTSAVAPAITHVLDLLSNADQSRADAARASQINALLTSRGPTADLFADTAALKAELAQIEQRQKLAIARTEEAERRALLGGNERQATRNLPPGFQPPVPKAPPSAKDKAGLDFSNGTQRNAISGGLESLTGINDILSDPRYLLEKSLEESLTQLATESSAERLALSDQTNQSFLSSLLTTNDAIISAEQYKNQTLGESLGSLVGLAIQQGGTLGKIGKAYAIAQTVWSTSTAIMRAMAEVPYPANLAAAAGIAARGVLQLANIKRTNIGSAGSVPGVSGGASGSITSSTPPATQAEDTDKSVSQVIINGNIFSSQETANWIIDQIREAVSTRDVVFIDNNSRQALELGA
jgi:hypothetical protein